MRRILFRWKGFEFYSYTILLYFGLISGTIVANLVAHSLHIDPFRVFIAQLSLIPFGFIGSRAMHAAFYWPVYSKKLRRLFDLHQGGGDQFGTYALTVVASVPLVKVLDIPFLTFWDVNIFSILVLMLITRFGCLLNGCCCGRPTHRAWGMNLCNSEGISCSRVPMQVLEASWVGLVLILCVSLLLDPPFPGVLFCTGTASYCAGRIMLDGFREDSYRWLGPITMHQCLYGTILLFCSVWFLLVA